jgi:hypothetical protein
VRRLLFFFYFYEGVLIVAWTDPIKTVTAGVDEVLADDWNTYVKNNMTSLYPLTMTVALSDESTAITTGAAKVTIRAPFAMVLTGIPRASLSTASTGAGPVAVDVNVNGTTILSTKLTLDDNEKTSVTAATAAVRATASHTGWTGTASAPNYQISDDAEITFDVDTAGTGAKGLKVTLFFVKA